MSESLVITERDAARLVGLSVRTMQRYRDNGGGPAYIVLGDRRVAYQRSDLAAWIAENRVPSRSEIFAKRDES